MEKLIITENARIFLYMVYAVMALFTLFALIMKGAKGDKLRSFGSNFLLRLRSFWVVVIIFTFAFIVNKATAFILIAGLSFLAVKEYMSFVPQIKEDFLIKSMYYIAIIFQTICIYTDWIIMFYIFVPLYMFLIMPISLLLKGQSKEFLKNCALIHWGLMSTVYAIGYLAVYLNFNIDENPVGGGFGLLLSILFLTIFNDFAQYACGKALGKHKITPAVSPNKTWEGFLGGVFVTVTLTFLIAPYLTPLNSFESLWVGLLISVTAFFGDLTISAIKRDVGVKDSGTLLPGHGGILDRLDSLIFTAPVFFHCTSYLVYLR